MNSTLRPSLLCCVKWALHPYSVLLTYLINVPDQPGILLSADGFTTVTDVMSRAKPDIKAQSFPDNRAHPLYCDVVECCGKYPDQHIFIKVYQYKSYKKNYLHFPAYQLTIQVVINHDPKSGLSS